mmetsp:Transcript_80175/g.259663  ORF Transcript_80175/g.259663 Transcript_80175/m.259663 type:complete len:264 (-) Transcript_80175:330-1121(-)
MSSNSSVQNRDLNVFSTEYTRIRNERKYFMSRTTRSTRTVLMMRMMRMGAIRCPLPLPLPLPIPSSTQEVRTMMRSSTFQRHWRETKKLRPPASSRSSSSVVKVMVKTSEMSLKAGGGSSSRMRAMYSTSMPKYRVLVRMRNMKKPSKRSLCTPCRSRSRLPWHGCRQWASASWIARLSRACLSVCILLMSIAWLKVLAHVARLFSPSSPSSEPRLLRAGPTSQVTTPSWLKALTHVARWFSPPSPSPPAPGLGFETSEGGAE